MLKFIRGHDRYVNNYHVKQNKQTNKKKSKCKRKDENKLGEKVTFGGLETDQEISLKETASEMSWNWTDGPEIEEMGL